MNPEIEDFIDILNENLEELILKDCHSIGMGGCMDFDNYKQRVGIVQGLMLAQQIVQKTQIQLQIIGDNDD